MFQVVDAEVGGLSKIDRTQVARYLGTALVCRLNRCLQLRARNEHIRFEVVDAFIEPVVHRLDRIVWSRQLMQLDRPRAFALEIWTGDMHLWTRRLTVIDRLLQFEIGVRLERPRGADRRHSPGTVESRETERHL